ncbi:MAG: amino acid adenylation domain-containing protein [Taibaiella sp.]|jgi:amino acid adenylation domain-containing protein
MNLEPKYINNILVLDLFWEQVRKYPNCEAVVYLDNNVSYKQLAQYCSDLAIFLQFLDDNLEKSVGIFMDPSIEVIIAAWGILISGNAYLPLSPEYPEERLKYMIKDSNVKIIITQEELKETLSHLISEEIQIITFTDVSKFKNSHQILTRVQLRNNLRSNSLAYTIYTSGSTGKPKGVMIEHQSIANQMNWLRETFNLDNKAVILQKTPMSFDAAQWEILALSCGSKIVMGTPGIYRNPRKLIETIVKYNVTILQCVPTLLNALLNIDEFVNCKSLTHVFSGGEALSKKIALEFIKILPECRLVNLYGPTECTINTSAFIVDENNISDSLSTVPIGAPICNTQYYILDGNQKPVMAGEVGELYIGGIGLARGYLNLPDLTAQNFLTNPFDPENMHDRIYKTGDLTHWNSDGTVQYVGRTDNQVKLRGFRIELDEIKVAIETHNWIKNAAVILKNDQNTGSQNLIAFVELNSKEAALMDQGNHDSHHQSKDDKAQVMMQLSNPGCRDRSNFNEIDVINLPGRTPTESQRKIVFARKSYRFYEGGCINKNDVLKLLEPKNKCNKSVQLKDLSYACFGEILRYFGQFISKERLLPKYGYASPGALYATQMYFELNYINNLKPGYYYYCPINHQIFFIQEKIDSEKMEIKIHFIGKKSAIEPIYKNNIQEVLEIEAGHMIGLFEKILPAYGLNINVVGYLPKTKKSLAVSDDDFYLGTFEIIPNSISGMDEQVDIYIQSHPGKIPDLKSAQYRYENGCLKKVANDIILRKHVIAINQFVYDRSSLGITVISRSTDWMGYIHLGRKLQSLQMNDMNFGFMSSGYSSKTGNNLPSAIKIEEILDKKVGPSYFFIGGRITDEQCLSEGMKEDAVHMKGPAEMIKEDLLNYLPDYMLPNKIIVLDEMPLTSNGKIDLKNLSQKNIITYKNKHIAPRNKIEKLIHRIWKKELKNKRISIDDNFFELGGDSLDAISIIHMINVELNTSLSAQTLFEVCTIEDIASKIKDENIEAVSRLIQLQSKGTQNPIYCWPGLGGYCMNLRLLAKEMGSDQPFYGIQAYGLNIDEQPYSTIKEMASEDLMLIKNNQPIGPYTLWGYSFGARVAFETAYQLEQKGNVVKELILIAPGSPKLKESNKSTADLIANYTNPNYVTILYSVFMGSISGPALQECLQIADCEERFIKYIVSKNSKLDPSIVKRIINVVAQTFEFKYSFIELKERQVKAPITIFKARGDDYSFIENNHGFSSVRPDIIDLKADHYSILKSSDIDELVEMIKFHNNIEPVQQDRVNLRRKYKESYKATNIIAGS